MQAGADLAVALTPACDHAGITLVAGKSIRAGAASDSVVARADEIQHDLAQGPCVDVARWQNRSLYAPDLNSETRWPQWAHQVREELGVQSLLSLLLFTHERSFGALNLYSDHPGAFTADDVAIAENLAAHLAVAVSDGNDIQDRGKSMISRTVIGQAEGILMERYKVGPAEGVRVPAPHLPGHQPQTRSARRRTRGNPAPPRRRPHQPRPDHQPADPPRRRRTRAGVTTWVSAVGNISLPCRWGLTGYLPISSRTDNHNDDRARDDDHRDREHPFRRHRATRRAPDDRMGR